MKILKVKIRVLRILFLTKQDTYNPSLKMIINHLQSKFDLQTSRSKCVTRELARIVAAEPGLLPW